jgi:drug/metabolite transporter (DMT)-like permease
VTPRTANLREYGLLILLATLWGGSYPLIKISLESIPPVTLMAVRVSLAAIILCTIAWSQRHRFPRDGNTWRAFLIQAFFNSIGAWTLLAWGQQYVDSGLAGVLNSTSPIFVILVTLVWTKSEDVGVLRLAGALFGLLGVSIIVGVGALSDLGKDLAAQLAILAGAMLYGFAAIYGKRFRDQAPVVTAAGTMIWATAFLWPLALVAEQPWRLDVGLRSASAAIALAVFSTAAALLIYFRLVNTIGSIGVASQSYLRSVVAIGIGVLFLHEALTQSLIIGAGVTIAGMVMINRK